MVSKVFNLLLNRTTELSYSLVSYGRVGQNRFSSQKLTKSRQFPLTKNETQTTKANKSLLAY